MNRLWLNQIAAVVRIELGKSLFSWRVAPLYLLTLLPVLVAAVVVVAARLLDETAQVGLDVPGGEAIIYANTFGFTLGALYLGCVWIFMNLFRGEVMDRSLHYYFLSPIRREVLVAGKFLSGWLAASALFLISTIGSMVVLQLHHGPRRMLNYLLGDGFGTMLAYSGVTVLACLGYGAVFLAVGLFLRNPIVPAAVFWVIEAANPFLPALLKKFSVIFYLRSLLPVTPDFGPFALVADPIPAYLSVPGLLLFAVAVLAIASLRIRKMEVAYGDD